MVWQREEFRSWDKNRLSSGRKLPVYFFKAVPDFEEFFVDGFISHLLFASGLVDESWLFGPVELLNAAVSFDAPEGHHVVGKQGRDFTNA